MPTASNKSVRSTQTKANTSTVRAKSNFCTLEPSPVAISRFDQMCARMSGTVTILGDIVNSDRVLWDDEE